MQKTVDVWSVEDLRNRFAEIEFPEYQREPTVWGRAAKKRLIDSMARDFDIASLYFYETEDGRLECVDGRQRIGAIMSFLGSNAGDGDNEFEFEISNEIYEDKSHPFDEVKGGTFQELKDAGSDTADALIRKILEYQLTIVKLSDSRIPEEFNLQFTRLNLGAIIVSGEKLHAMVGALRDVCFNGLGGHELLRGAKMSTRRYAKQQTAAQIVAQVFAFEEGMEKTGIGGYARTRHFDLQRLFKRNRKLSEERREWLGRLTTVMDALGRELEDGVLTSRAMTVSAVRFAYERDGCADWDPAEVAEFLKELGKRLQWQVKRRLDYDREYRYLMDFQREVTQASVEKRAVSRRGAVLKEQFERWQATGRFEGDDAFKRRYPDREIGEN